MSEIQEWKRGKLIEPTRIGFVSTRFAGTDGVSLEAQKWAQVLEGDGHICFWYAGSLDQPAECSYCVPEAFFGYPENEWIGEEVWRKSRRSDLVTERINQFASYLKSTLYDFVRSFDLKVLIFENVLSIPMHIPLGVAASQMLSETHIPSIGHHHDFSWERTRFRPNAVSDILDMSFPPREQDLQHVVINLDAQEELAHRKGISSLLIPNVLDFEKAPLATDEYASDFREAIGLKPDDKVVLQPTRIIPRKGIEYSIQLVQRLGDSAYKLIMTHEAGDEGLEYRKMLVEYAKQLGVDLRFVAARVGEQRWINRSGEKVYTLADIYPSASLVTYPSLYEGFGNAFLEAIYFKIPLLVNRYAIFGRDIEPKGFRVAIMENFITDEVVSHVKKLIHDNNYRKEVVEHNYKVATRYYSFAELRRNLRMLIGNVGSLYKQ